MSIRQSQTTDFPIQLLEKNYGFFSFSLSFTFSSSYIKFLSLPPGKVVYISMGTLYSQDPKFFLFCFESFKNTDYFVVLSVGRTTNVEDLGEIPSNFVVRGFVPQLEVLQRVCDFFFLVLMCGGRSFWCIPLLTSSPPFQTSAFISHGGMNGISESMFFNVPMILLPKTVEQELNAVCSCCCWLLVVILGHCVIID